MHPFALSILAVLIAAASNATAPGAADSYDAGIAAIRDGIAHKSYAAAESIAVRLLATAPPDSNRAADVIEGLLDARSMRGHAADPDNRDLGMRALRIREAAYGPDHPAVGTFARKLSRIIYEWGDMADGRSLAERAVRIHEATLGPMDPELSESLDNMAFFYGASGKLDDALALYRRVLEIRKAAPQPDSLRIAATLHRVGFTLTALGKYPEAIPPFEEALRIRAAHLPPTAPAIATVTNDMALPYYYLAQYARAETLLIRALKIREGALGPQHPMVAKTLDQLALVYFGGNRLDDARRCWTRSVAIYEAAQGARHRDLGVALQNMMMLEQEAGAYERAAEIGERVLKIHEADLGPTHILTGDILSGLASVYLDLGDRERARRYLERSVSIQEAALGPDHPDLAAALSSLGLLLFEQDDSVAARPLLERALKIRETALGADHPLIAEGLCNIGLLSAREGKDEEARRDLERSLALFEKNFGPGSPRSADPLGGLAGIAESHGDLARAESLYTEALRIRTAHLGEAHPLVAETLERVGGVEAKERKWNPALRHALRAQKISRDHMRLMLGSAPEQVALALSVRRPAGLDLALGIVAEGGAGPAAADSVFDALIRSRTLVLDEMAERRRALRAAAEAGVESGADSLLAALDTARRREARIMLREESEPGEDYATRIDAARRRVETAERALAQSCAALRPQLDAPPAGLAEVLAARPAGAALVSYARVERDDAAGGSFYGAFVVPASGTDRTQAAGSVAQPGADTQAATSAAAAAAIFVRLGDAASIDDLVGRWRDEARLGATIPDRDVRTAEDSYRNAAGALRRAAWDAIASRIGETERVLIVPSGSLCLVNFAALPADGGGYLIERAPLFHEVGAERDIVAYAAPTPARARTEPILAVGAPDFDAPPGGIRASNAAFRPDEPARRSDLLASAMRGAPVACDQFRDAKFRPIPGSAQEVRAIAELSGSAARVLTGAAANEEAFKTLAGGRRIVHLATHGFFLGEECSTGETEGTTPGRSGAVGTVRGVSGLTADGGKTAAALATHPDGTGAAAPRIENPLLLSGLALAGANRRASAGDAGADGEDGILTAEEIGALDLDGVEWAVLSACETGVGVVHAGEGVIGLQRAFRIAGARTVVTSLWAVEDKGTRDWMSALYSARLEESLDSASCVREAGRKMLERERAAGRGGHPYRWGSFVAIGDWR